MYWEKPGFPPSELRWETGLNHCPRRDDTGSRGEHSVLGINQCRFLEGLLNVVIGIRDLRIGGISNRVPLYVRELLHGVANHRIAHVAALV